jgi:hypothetical protein
LNWAVARRSFSVLSVMPVNELVVRNETRLNTKRILLGARNFEITRVIGRDATGHDESAHVQRMRYQCETCHIPVLRTPHEVLTARRRECFIHRQNDHHARKIERSNSGQ